MTCEYNFSSQNLHAFRTTFNTKLWRWKLGIFFLRVTPLLFACIQLYNNIKWCSSFWTRWMCNIFLYLIGTDRLCNCCFYECHEAIVYQWDAQSVSVMPLHNWGHPLWGFVFNVIKNTSLLKKPRDCMLRFVCHLRLSPPSMMGNCNPFSVSDASSLRWLASIACHSSSSVCLLNGSRLSRRVPENNTGSCAETIHDS